VGLEKFPFTSYDFWAYLASGFLLLAAVDVAAATGFLLQKDCSWPQTAVAVAGAYVAGQLTAGLSSIVFERGLVGRVLGYPLAVFNTQSLHASRSLPRPLRTTAATSLMMTPEVRSLCVQCAAAENRSLTNMFEVMVRDRAKTLNLQPRPAPVPASRKAASSKKTKN
jgi:hypothetical protein